MSPLNRLMRRRPQRPRGVALFVVIALLGVIGIIAVYIHRYSRQQRYQSHRLSSAEVAYRAASFGARQGYLLVQQGVAFLNSTDPGTCPKQEQPPASLKTFCDYLVKDDGRLADDPVEVLLPMPDSPMQKMVTELGSHLQLQVTLKLERQEPLLAEPPFPGLQGETPERRGRFVVDALAVYRGVSRRVVSVFEARTIQMQWPVVGRFVLSCSGHEGTLNALEMPLKTGKRKIPQEFGSPALAPFVIEGGDGIAPGALPSIRADPAGFLDRQGWVALFTPSTGDAEQWSLGTTPGPDGFGEDFLLTANRVFFHPIVQGSGQLGIAVPNPSGGQSYELWKTHQRYACLTGLYPATKEPQRNQLMRNHAGNTQKSAMIHLMGRADRPSPTLVFGKVYRHYLLEQGIRRKRLPPKAPEDASVAAPCPYVLEADFNRAQWVPAMEPGPTAVLRQACGNTWDTYRDLMCLPLRTAYNEGLAFFFDQTPAAGSRPLQPTFTVTQVPKLGRGLSYTPGAPESMILDGPVTLIRDGRTVYAGELQQVLPNLGRIAKARCARSFRSGDALQRFLNEVVQQGKNPAGFYHVAGAFTWTDAFNRLAVGGVGIVADGTLTVSAEVAPSRPPTVVDAAQNVVSLVSLTGDIIINTSQRVRAALLAPVGKLRCLRPIDIDILGLVAVHEFQLTGFANGRNKRLRYDPIMDWASNDAYQRSFRIMLEHQPLLFVAKPK